MDSYIQYEISYLQCSIINVLINQMVHSNPIFKYDIFSVIYDNPILEYILYTPDENDIFKIALTTLGHHCITTIDENKYYLCIPIGE